MFVERFLTICLTFFGLVTLGDSRMASVYRRPRSRFFWVKFRDPGTGKICYQSTGIDATLPGAHRRAKARQAALTQKEMAAPRTNERERWEAWAQDYFEQRYAGTGSHKGAMLALRDLMAFFKAHDIGTPRRLDYTAASKFVPWRVSNRTLKTIHHNSARLRFIYLGVLMDEALRRGFCDFNPCRSVRVKRVAAKVKLEITRADERRILKALRKKKPWMREQWDVLMLTGCRLAESRVAMSEVDERRDVMRLRLKGGKIYPVRIHPDLRPLIARARKERRVTLIEPPPNPGPIWSQFFDALGMPYSIHCTRVTAITNMLRAGHSVAMVCARIGHSEAVNVIYRRLLPDDTAALDAALAGVSIPLKDSRSRKTRGRRAATQPRARSSSARPLPRASSSRRAASP